VLGRNNIPIVKQLQTDRCQIKFQKTINLILKGGVCQSLTCSEYISDFRVSNFTMALGAKVLIILVVACSFGVGVVMLPTTPQTASAFNCIVVTHECLETTDPVDLIAKMFPDAMSIPHYN
jgi:hypothetical protein